MTSTHPLDHFLPPTYHPTTNWFTAMATLKQKADGDFYLIQGYPVTVHGRIDMKFAGYEVLPRANAFFLEANFRDGEKLDLSVFYLLLYEGDIPNTAVQGRRFSFDMFPPLFMDRVHRLARQPALLSCLAGPQFQRCRSYLDFFRAFIAMPHEPAVKPAAQSAPFISKKEYGIRFNLKGSALRKAHEDYRNPHEAPSTVAPSRIRIPDFLCMRDYGIKFKLKGQALKRAHKQYRQSLQARGQIELPSRAQRRQDIETAALLCLVWHYSMANPIPRGTLRGAPPCA